MTILEARDRVGGRAYTLRDKDLYYHYDLGPSWLHDVEINGLYKVAQENNVRLYEDGRIRYFSKSESDSPDSTIFQAHAKLVKAFTDAYSDPSLEDTNIRHFANKWLAAGHVDLSSKQKDQVLQLLQYIETFEALPWDMLSSRYCCLDHAGKDLFVAGGYDKIAQGIINTYGEPQNIKIVLNTTVNRIQQTGSSVILHTTNSSTSSSSSYTAQFAVVTASLGVLKAGMIQFEPKLPPALTSAISSLGFACLAKIVFEFESVFWDNDFDEAAFLVDIKDGKMATDSGHPSISKEAWCAPVSVVNQYAVHGKPVLLGLLVPPLSQYFESHPDEVVSYFEFVFQRLNKDKSQPIPKLKRHIITNWSNDPLTQGTYSCVTEGVDLRKVTDTFAEGFDRVRFAGEHTDFDGICCTHGAFKSGRREAEKLVQLLNRNKL